MRPVSGNCDPRTKDHGGSNCLGGITAMTEGFCLPPLRTRGHTSERLVCGATRQGSVEFELRATQLAARCGHRTP
jgi:hypothetical protein